MNPQFFYALVDPDDTTFDPDAHARSDLLHLSVTFDQHEGDFASLEIVTQMPVNLSGDALGLLGLGRKYWLWWSWDIGDGPEPLFFGRLLGFPKSNSFDRTVTFEFSARPQDLVDQKAALNDELRVLPYWTKTLIDKQRWDDPDLVLEAYAAVWHYDPVTHVASKSDYLIGEGGLLTFNANDIKAAGFQASIEMPPLTAASADVLFNWTQRAAGNIDLTSYITDNWPNETAEAGVITSFSMDAESWPKAGASLGEGWTATQATCLELYPLDVRQHSEGSTVTIKWWDGANTSVTSNISDDYLVSGAPPGSIALGDIVTDSQSKSAYQNDGEQSVLTSFSTSSNWTNGIIPLHHLQPTLIAAYDAARPMVEHVTMTLAADVQAVETMPDDGEVLRLDNIGSSDLSELIDDEAPIGDPRRRSYIVTVRGEQDLQHVILLLRAALLKRSRCVEITFAPTDLSRLPEIRLNKTARIYHPSLPGGTALGKITGFHFSLDGGGPQGGAGKWNFTVTIGCAVGNGGEVTDVRGTPTYAAEGYAELGWQEYEGATVAFNSDVGYTPAAFAPNDDGIDFINGVSLASAIDTALSIENPPAQQRIALESINWAGAIIAGAQIQSFQNPEMTPQQLREQTVSARSQAYNDMLNENATVAKSKLKSMTASFETPIELTLTSLKVPSMIDLQAT